MMTFCELRSAGFAAALAAPVAQSPSTQKPIASSHLRIFAAGYCSFEA